MPARATALLLILPLLATPAALAQVSTHALAVASPPTPLMPDGFVVETLTPADTFYFATAIAFAPDGRVFVAEKRGRVYVIRDGVKQEPPFLNIEDEVLDNNDRGLIGLALDPHFADNGHVYLVYAVDYESTADAFRVDAFGRVARYTASAADPDVADPASRRVLLGGTFAEGFPACWISHTPNTLRWGTDGTLLISAGDGASHNLEPPDAGGLYPTCFDAGKLEAIEDIGSFRAQYPGSYGGKILRIDPETGLGLPSNPFYTGDPADKASRVWSYGLRNPFRFGVRPNGSLHPEDGQPGSLYIGDVGWNLWEDVNIATSGGENFGWPCFEGPEQNPLHQGATPLHSDCTLLAEQVPPALYWHHTDPDLSNPQGRLARSITVGEFYLGHTYPARYQGSLFFTDFMEVWMGFATFDDGDHLVDQDVFGTAFPQITDLRYNPYTQQMHYLYVDLWTGDSEVFRIRHPEGEANVPPVAQATADVLEGDAPLAVQFDAGGSDDADGQDLTYHWDFGNGDTSEETAPRYTFSDDGVYTVTLTVADPFNVVATTSVVVHVGEATAVEESTLPDHQPKLAGNYPNPFSGRTTITFEVAAYAQIELTVYDVLGRQVRRLAHGSFGAGVHRAPWDGLGDDGRAAPNGLYFYQLRSDGRLVETRRMIRIQ